MTRKQSQTKSNHTLENFTTKWYFFVILLLAQSVILPFATRNFAPEQIGHIVSVTLSNAPHAHMGRLNIVFQALSAIMLLLTFVLRGRIGRLFSAYVALSYLFFSFIQNIAITELYGFSMVTVNVLMFLFVAYVWLREVIRHENSYDFSNFSWKHLWMIILAVFAYFCPFDMQGQLDFNPLHFFLRNSASAFCLTTPLFLTIMTLNLPKINIVTYRITAIIGFIIGIYNMFSFANPHTIWLGFLHLPLLIISLYCVIVSYTIRKKANLVVKSEEIS